MSSESFGRRAADATSATQLLELELENGRAARFETLDLLTGEVFVVALRGGKPVTVGGTETRRRGRPGTLRITGASAQQRAMLDENFSVERQQSRGAGKLHVTPHLALAEYHWALVGAQGHHAPMCVVSTPPCYGYRRMPHLPMVAGLFGFEKSALSCGGDDARLLGS